MRSVVVDGKAMKGVHTFFQRGRVLRCSPQNVKINMFNRTIVFCTVTCTHISGTVSVKRVACVLILLSQS